MRKIKFPSPDGTAQLDAMEIDVEASSERWCEYKLEDGTVMRARPLILNYIRVDGLYDSEGNPVYAMRGTLQHTVVSVPDELKKPTGGPEKKPD